MIIQKNRKKKHYLLRCQLCFFSSLFLVLFYGSFAFAAKPSIFSLFHHATQESWTSKSIFIQPCKKDESEPSYSKYLNLNDCLTKYNEHILNFTNVNDSYFQLFWKRYRTYILNMKLSIISWNVASEKEKDKIRSRLKTLKLDLSGSLSNHAMYAKYYSLLRRPSYEGSILHQEDEEKLNLPEVFSEELQSIDLSAENLEKSQNYDEVLCDVAPEPMSSLLSSYQKYITDFDQVILHAFDHKELVGALERFNKNVEQGSEEEAEELILVEKEIESHYAELVKVDEMFYGGELEITLKKARVNWKSFFSSYELFKKTCFKLIEENKDD